MKSYGVSEVFFSVQGEGAYTGTPMAFLRLAGCNLWDGIEEHRPRGTGSCADWCDASFLPKLGRMLAEEIAKYLRFVAPGCHHACVTGGEPTLQWDAGLAGAIAAAGFDEISMETNGTTIGAPPGVTWLTLSPKRDRAGAWTHRRLGADEVKVVHSRRFHALSGDDLDYLRATLAARHYFVQPCDESSAPILAVSSLSRPGAATAQSSRENEQDAVQLVLSRPEWRLSQQTNKRVGLP